MSNDSSPDDLSRADFRIVFRGYDQSEVAARLDELARRVSELVEERDRLSTRLGEFAERDLKTEFESVGREVSSVLEAARTAAETMRDRASADAARWRSEAMAEVEAMRKDARADAEALRGDAWTTASQMLDQVADEVERLRQRAERDSLSTIGEAEREAHRLTAAGRREAEEVVRNAKMEAEQMSAQAKAEHDDLIATAQRQAEAAQERTRALEQRRGELMAELESVRAALSSVEGELEDKRQGIGLSEEPALPKRAVVADEEGVHATDWEDGHTVRIIHPTRPPKPLDPDDTDAESLAEEVARLRQSEPSSEPEDRRDDEPGELVVDPTLEEEPQAEALDPEPEPVDEPETREISKDDSDDVGDLFARLRSPASPRPADPSAENEAIPTVDEASETPHPASANGSGVDAFAVRERLLLPVTNEVLRNVKRILTDAQNEALEQLRVTEGDWKPNASAYRASLRPDLSALVDGSTHAAREAAAKWGIDPDASPDAVDVGVDDLADDLASVLESALQSSGGGARERSAATSKVFRGWRSDEAERRVRGLALAAYHAALRHAFDSSGLTWKWEAAGRMCATCRQRAESGDEVPPAHRDCGCTITLS